jgi:hypothetical protein
LHRLGENDAESPALSHKRRPDDRCAGLPARVRRPCLTKRDTPFGYIHKRVCRPFWWMASAGLWTQSQPISWKTERESLPRRKNPIYGLRTHSWFEVKKKPAAFEERGHRFDPDQVHQITLLLTAICRHRRVTFCGAEGAEGC